MSCFFSGETDYILMLNMQSWIWRRADPAGRSCRPCAATTYRHPWGRFSYRRSSGYGSGSSCGATTTIPNPAAATDACSRCSPCGSVWRGLGHFGKHVPMEIVYIFWGALLYCNQQYMYYCSWLPMTWLKWKLPYFMHRIEKQILNYSISLVAKIWLNILKYICDIVAYISFPTF